MECFCLSAYASHRIYFARIKSHVPRMSVCEERNLEGEGNNVVSRSPTGRKKRIVPTKSGERVGRIKFSNCTAWELRIVSAPACDRWIKNNGNVEFSVARLLLRRLFSIAENNKKCINRTLAAAGDDTATSSTRQPKARAARIIEHRFHSILCYTHISEFILKKELTIFCKNILDTYVRYLILCNIFS